MLVRAEAMGIATDVDKPINQCSMDGTTLREAGSLQDEADTVANTADIWLSKTCPSMPGLPEDVSLFVPGWTAAELLQIFKPIYPATQGVQSPNKLTTMVSNKIRRFPNPEFQSRFSSESHTAAEYLYDKSAALFFAATRWGGSECNLQAIMASQELGCAQGFTLRIPGCPVADI